MKSNANQGEKAYNKLIYCQVIENKYKILISRVKFFLFSYFDENNKKEIAC
jgi:hypothetical protein